MGIHAQFNLPLMIIILCIVRNPLFNHVIINSIIDLNFNSFLDLVRETEEEEEELFYINNSRNSSRFIIHLKLNAT